MIKADLHNHLGRNGANKGIDNVTDFLYNKFSPNLLIVGICNCGPDDYRFQDFVNQNGKYERNWLNDEKSIISFPEKNIFHKICSGY